MKKQTNLQLLEEKLSTHTLSAVENSIIRKIKKCNDKEIGDFLNNGAMPALKLNTKEMELIKAGWSISFVGGNKIRIGLKGGEHTGSSWWDITSIKVFAGSPQN